MKTSTSALAAAVIILILISDITADVPADLKSRIAARVNELANKQIQLNIVSEDNGFDNYDVTYYRVDLQVFPTERSIAGDVTIKAEILKDNSAEIQLNFYNTLIISDIAGNISAYTHANNLITIDLDRIYNKSEMVEITISYAGDPNPGTSPVPFKFVKQNNKHYISTDNQPYYARTWFPCNDSPGDKADSADIIVTVPQNLFVVSNGILQQTIHNQDATKTFHWHEKYPIATYLISLAIANYTLIEDEYISATGDTMPLHHYVFPEDLAKARVDFELTDEAIHYFVPYFGEYPFLDEKYGHAEYRGNYGGMENQTMTSIYYAYIQGNQSSEFLIAHELAHQWWGDWVTPAHFDHIWINEGFATYSEVIYAREKYGQETADLYMDYILNSALNQNGSIFRHGSDNIITGIVYDKGASVLHMLRHVVGDTAFRSVLIKYGSAFAFSYATTEDFQQFCEEEYGESLDWFFQQWIYEPGHPHYQYAWTSTELQNSRYEISGYIDQVQNEGPVFQMPLDITLINVQAETTTQTILASKKSESFMFISDSEPLEILFDKDNKILKRTTQVEALPQITYRGHRFTEPGGNGYWDQGETIELVLEIENKGVGVDGATVTLSTRDETIEIQKPTIEFGRLAHLETASNSEIPFQLTLKTNEEGYLSTILMTISGADNYSAADSFVVEVGQPDILLVDDDNDDSYESYVLPHLRDVFIYADIWNQTSDVSLDTAAQNFKTLVWLTGDDRVTSLTANEQSVIIDFLNQGGNLLISGQNIGYNLIADGSVQDSLFYSTYLKSSYIKDTAAPKLLIGVAGDPVTDGIYVSLEGNYGGAENQDSPDVIAPLNPATEIFQFTRTLEGAGLKYHNPETGSRLIYLPFGIEGIAGPYKHSAGTFYKRCFDWFAGMTDVRDAENNFSLPADFQLWQNYPNPFNASTNIQYMLPRNSLVTITITDILGRKVRALVSGKKSAGRYLCQWDGRDSSGNFVASGLYFSKMRAGKFIESKKMLFLK